MRQIRMFGRLGLGLILAATLSAPAWAQGSAPEGFEWGYNKGFFFRNPQFELKISTRTQFRYTYFMTDPDSTIGNNGVFTIPRARLRLDGYAFYSWIKYKVQYDFEGDTDACVGPACTVIRRPDLRDLYFDITRQPWYSVRLGQFKVPFGLQELTSSGDQEFVDRSLASELFAPSRQQGAMLWGLSFEKKFGYEAGLFNGNGRNRVANDDVGYLYAVRVHWDPNGEYKLSESAVDHPDTVNWTIGAAYNMNSIQKSLLKTADHLRQDTAEGFFGLKYKRLFVLADYYLRRVQQTGTNDRADRDGYIAQVGVFVTQKIEVSGRYSTIDINKDMSDDKSTERRLGFGWYFSKHELKFQADYGQVHEELLAPADDRTNVFRSQLQIVF